MSRPLVNLGGVYVNCDDVFAVEPVDPMLTANQILGDDPKPPREDWPTCVVYSHHGKVVEVPLPAAEVNRLRNLAMARTTPGMVERTDA